MNYEKYLLSKEEESFADIQHISSLGFRGNSPAESRLQRRARERATKKMITKEVLSLKRREADAARPVLKLMQEFKAFKAASPEEKQRIIEASKSN